MSRVLDTQALLWFVLDDPRLPGHIADLILVAEEFRRPYRGLLGQVLLRRARAPLGTFGPRYPSGGLARPAKSSG